LPEPRASEAEEASHRGRRLHPAAIAVWAIEGVFRFAIGFLALVLVRPRWLPVLLAVLGLSVLGSVIRYLRFTYRLDPGALVVQGGFLNTWRRVIPLARIQSVDLVQKLRHRALGVVELRVEAAGGHETEAALVALRPAEADALRAKLLDRGGPPARPDVRTAPLAKLRPAELLLAGVTGGRVAVIAVLLGYAQELLPDDLILGVFDRLEGAGAATLLLLLAAIAAFLLVSLVISIVATILVYWEFTVVRDDGRLIVTRGLFEKRRAVVPVSRIQAVRMDENLLRRTLGLASLTAVTAAHTRRSDEEQETSLLLPVARKAVAERVAADLLGVDSEVLSAPLERPSSRALIPRMGVWGTLGLAAGIAGLIGFGAPGAVTFALLPLFVALALASWRALGSSLDGRLAVVRSGVMVCRTTFVPVANLQHLGLTAGPVQRALRLASIRLAIPRARPTAEHLDRDRAHQRFAHLADRLVEG
jgi:putative membrane protein